MDFSIIDNLISGLGYTVLTLHHILSYIVSSVFLTEFTTYNSFIDQLLLSTKHVDYVSYIKETNETHFISESTDEINTEKVVLAISVIGLACSRFTSFQRNRYLNPLTFYYIISIITQLLPIYGISRLVFVFHCIIVWFLVKNFELPCITGPIRKYTALTLTYLERYQYFRTFLHLNQFNLQGDLHHFEVIPPLQDYIIIQDGEIVNGSSLYNALPLRKRLSTYVTGDGIYDQQGNRVEPNNVENYGSIVFLKQNPFNSATVQGYRLDIYEDGYIRISGNCNDIQLLTRYSQLLPPNIVNTQWIHNNDVIDAKINNNDKNIGYIQTILSLNTPDIVKVYEICGYIKTYTRLNYGVVFTTENPYELFNYGKEEIDRANQQRQQNQRPQQQIQYGNRRPEERNQEHRGFWPTWRSVVRNPFRNGVATDNCITNPNEPTYQFTGMTQQPVMIGVPEQQIIPRIPDMIGAPEQHIMPRIPDIIGVPEQNNMPRVPIMRSITAMTVQRNQPTQLPQSIQIDATEQVPTTEREQALSVTEIDVQTDESSQNAQVPNTETEQVSNAIESILIDETSQNAQVPNTESEQVSSAIESILIGQELGVSEVELFESAELQNTHLNSCSVEEVIQAISFESVKLRLVRDVNIENNQANIPRPSASIAVGTQELPNIENSQANIPCPSVLIAVGTQELPTTVIASIDERMEETNPTSESTIPCSNVTKEINPANPTSPSAPKELSSDVVVPDKVAIEVEETLSIRAVVSQSPCHGASTQECDLPASTVVSSLNPQYNKPTGLEAKDEEGLEIKFAKEEKLANNPSETLSTYKSKIKKFKRKSTSHSSDFKAEKCQKLQPRTFVKPIEESIPEEEIIEIRPTIRYCLSSSNSAISRSSDPQKDGMSENSVVQQAGCISIAEEFHGICNTATDKSAQVIHHPTIWSTPLLLREQLVSEDLTVNGFVTDPSIRGGVSLRNFDDIAETQVKAQYPCYIIEAAVNKLTLQKQGVDTSGLITDAKRKRAQTADDPHVIAEENLDTTVHTVHSVNIIYDDSVGQTQSASHAPNIVGIQQLTTEAPNTVDGLQQQNDLPQSGSVFQSHPVSCPDSSTIGTQDVSTALANVPEVSNFSEHITQHVLLTEPIDCSKGIQKYFDVSSLRVLASAAALVAMQGQQLPNIPCPNAPHMVGTQESSPNVLCPNAPPLVGTQERFPNVLCPNAPPLVGTQEQIPNVLCPNAPPLVGTQEQISDLKPVCTKQTEYTPVVIVSGPNHPLSNEYVAPFFYNGIVYQSVAHLYFALMAKFNKQPAIFERILNTTNLEEMRAMSNYEVDENWFGGHGSAASILHAGAYEKFQNPTLREELIRTKCMRIAFPGEDRYFCTGLSIDQNQSFPATWEGRNVAGRVLENLREIINSEDQSTSAIITTNELTTGRDICEFEASQPIRRVIYGGGGLQTKSYSGAASSSGIGLVKIGEMGQSMSQATQFDFLLKLVDKYCTRGQVNYEYALSSHHREYLISKDDPYIATRVVDGREMKFLWKPDSSISNFFHPLLSVLVASISRDVQIEQPELHYQTIMRELFGVISFIKCLDIKTPDGSKMIYDHNIHTIIHCYNTCLRHLWHHTKSETERESLRLQYILDNGKYQLVSDYGRAGAKVVEIMSDLCGVGKEILDLGGAPGQMYNYLKASGYNVVSFSPSISGIHYYKAIRDNPDIHEGEYRVDTQVGRDNILTVLQKNGKAKNIHLTIGDAAYCDNWQDETRHASFIAGQALVALYSGAPDSTFVVKCIGVDNKSTAYILALIGYCYGSLSFIKPLTSPPNRSELYVKYGGLQNIPASVVTKLKEIADSHYTYSELNSAIAEQSAGTQRRVRIVLDNIYQHNLTHCTALETWLSSEINIARCSHYTTTNVRDYKCLRDRVNFELPSNIDRECTILLEEPYNQLLINAPVPERYETILRTEYPHDVIEAVYPESEKDFEECSHKLSQFLEAGGYQHLSCVLSNPQKADLRPFYKISQPRQLTEDITRLLPCCRQRTLTCCFLRGGTQSKAAIALIEIERTPHLPITANEIIAAAQGHLCLVAFKEQLEVEYNQPFTQPINYASVVSNGIKKETPPIILQNTSSIEHHEQVLASEEDHYERIFCDRYTNADADYANTTIISEQPCRENYAGNIKQHLKKQSNSSQRASSISSQPNQAGSITTSYPVLYPKIKPRGSLQSKDNTMDEPNTPVCGNANVPKQPVQPPTASHSLDSEQFPPLSTIVGKSKSSDSNTSEPNMVGVPEQEVPALNTTQPASNLPSTMPKSSITDVAAITDMASNLLCTVPIDCNSSTSAKTGPRSNAVANCSAESANSGRNRVETFYSTKSLLSPTHYYKIVIDGIEFTTAEQYALYCLAKQQGETGMLQEILKAPAGKLAGYYRYIDMEECREEFLETIYDCFAYFYEFKAAIYPRFRRVLISTYPALLAYTDQNETLLGVGLPFYDEKVQDCRLWNGENIVGEVLLELRDTYVDGHKPHKHARIDDPNPSTKSNEELGGASSQPERRGSLPTNPASNNAISDEDSMSPLNVSEEFSLPTEPPNAFVENPQPINDSPQPSDPMQHLEGNILSIESRLSAVTAYEPTSFHGVPIPRTTPTGMQLRFGVADEDDDDATQAFYSLQNAAIVPTTGSAGELQANDESNVLALIIDHYIKLSRNQHIDTNYHTICHFLSEHCETTTSTCDNLTTTNYKFRANKGISRKTISRAANINISALVDLVRNDKDLLRTFAPDKNQFSDYQAVSLARVLITIGNYENNKQYNVSDFNICFGQRWGYCFPSRDVFSNMPLLTFLSNLPEKWVKRHQNNYFSRTSYIQENFPQYINNNTYNTHPTFVLKNGSEVSGKGEVSAASVASSIAGIGIKEQQAEESKETNIQNDASLPQPISANNLIAPNVTNGTATKPKFSISQKMENLQNLCTIKTANNEELTIAFPFNANAIQIWPNQTVITEDDRVRMVKYLIDNDIDINFHMYVNASLKNTVHIVYDTKRDRTQIERICEALQIKYITPDVHSERYLSQLALVGIIGSIPNMTELFPVNELTVISQTQAIYACNDNADIAKRIGAYINQYGYGEGDEDHFYWAYRK